MSDPANTDPKAPGDNATSSQLRIATLVGPDGTLGAAELLRQTPGIQVVEASSLSALLELVRASTIAAVVADPEQGEGWPANTADQIVAQVRDLVPIILICRGKADATLMEQRLAGPGVRIALHEALTPKLLAEVIAGMSAAHQTRPANGPASAAS